MNTIFDRARLKDATSSPLALAGAVEPGFDFLSDEYLALFTRSEATAFQAPMWLHKLHKVLAPKLEAQQHTITLRHQATGALAAVFPLVRQSWYGLEIVQPADFGVSDYNAIVAPVDTLKRIANDAGMRRSIDRLAGGHILLFRKVRDDGFDVSQIFTRMTASAAENSAFHTEQGESIETWQAALPSGMVKKLGQLSRRMEKEHGAYAHLEVRSEAEIRQAFALLRRVRTNRFERDLLDDEAYFTFYLDYAIAAAQTGEAATYVGRVDDRIVAMLFGAMGDGVFHGLLIGADTETFGKFSVGRQVYYHAILDQFAQGKPQLDLSLGDSGYKSSFRVTETKLRNFSAARSLRGAAVALVYHHAKPLKNRLSALAPKLR